MLIIALDVLLVYILVSLLIIYNTLTIYRHGLERKTHLEVFPELNNDRYCACCGAFRVFKFILFEFTTSRSYCCTDRENKKTLCREPSHVGLCFCDARTIRLSANMRKLLLQCCAQNVQKNGISQ